jgi:hypothetical protein
MKNPFEIVNNSPNKENIIIFIHGYTGTNDTWKMSNGDMPFISKLLEIKEIKEK